MQTTYQIWKKKNKNPFIHGKWMKRTSKLKENGSLMKPSMQMVDIWLRKKQDTQAAYAFLLV